MTTQLASGLLASIAGGGRHLGTDVNGGWVCAFESDDVAVSLSALPTESALS